VSRSDELVETLNATPDRQAPRAGWEGVLRRHVAADEAVCAETRERGRLAPQLVQPAIDSELPDAGDEWMVMLRAMTMTMMMIMMRLV